MMDEIMVRFQSVEKNFGRAQALTGLDLAVPKGCIYGLLGRNGAGKTTSLRLMLNLLKPSKGKIEIMGLSPASLPQYLRAKMGYSSDSLPLIPWVKVSDMLDYNGAFYPDWDAQYVLNWLKRFELNPNKRIFSLSRGEKQKVGLLMAIGHRPELILLDEPAGGLDPVVRQEFLDSMIELLHETGTTIIISSHQMSDLERLVDWIGILEGGKMQLQAPLDDLRTQIRRISIYESQIAVETPVPLPGGLAPEKGRGYMRFIHPQWRPEYEILIESQWPEMRLQIDPLSLEEIFLLYQKKGLETAEVVS